MPINDYFIFDGKKCTDYGLYMASDPQAIHPARRGELFPIPGRNGSIVREDGSYDTFTQTYDVFFDSNTKAADVYGLARKVAAWLLGSRGFCRLEDSYEPEYFRLARCAEQMGVENRLARFGRSKIEFECQPQRYLKSGESAFRFSSTGSSGGFKKRVRINPIPNDISSIRFDVLVSPTYEIGHGYLRLENSQNDEQYTVDNMHVVSDTGDWKYTNVMGNSKAQFKAGQRYSFGSRAFVSNNNPACDCVVIPIPASNSTVRIRVKNATFSTYNTIYGGTTNNLFGTDYGRHTVNPAPTDENGDFYFDFTNSGSRYITFNLNPVSDPSALIVTVDEPIIEINADGLVHYVGSLNVSDQYDTVIASTHMLSANSKVTYVKTDGSEFAAASFEGTFDFALYNPTEFESRPLIKFSKYVPSPVEKNLTVVDDTFINSQGYVKEAYWEVDKGKTFTTQPVTLSGNKYVYITAQSYSFLDSNDNIVKYGHKKTGNTDAEPYFRDMMLEIPASAAKIVLGGNVGVPVSLKTQTVPSGLGSANAYINNTNVAVNFQNGDTIFLDCDLHDAYYVDGSSANDAVTFTNEEVEYPTFPGLSPGENVITLFNTDAFVFEIAPRWWTL